MKVTAQVGSLPAMTPISKLTPPVDYWPFFGVFHSSIDK